MKIKLITAAICMLSLTTFAQSEGDENLAIFNGYYYSQEYQVYFRLNLSEQGMEVPNHELLGNMPGYLAKNHNNFYWLITDWKYSKAHKKSKAPTIDLSLINDYGSEDFTATLKKINDSIYSFKQTEGNILKIPNNGKWQKLPKELLFKKK